MRTSKQVRTSKEVRTSKLAFTYWFLSEPAWCHSGVHSDDRFENNRNHVYALATTLVNAYDVDCYTFNLYSAGGMAKPGKFVRPVYSGQTALPILGPCDRWEWSVTVTWTAQTTGSRIVRGDCQKVYERRVCDICYTLCSRWLISWLVVSYFSPSSLWHRLCK